MSNLLSILAAATGRPPDDLAGEHDSYGALKRATADAVVSVLEPIQARRAELLSDPGELDRLMAMGADKARATSSVVLERAYRAIGLRG